VIDVSQKARQRLRWFDYYRAHGNNAARTCRYFGISRQTFYRWKRRYDPGDLRSWEERSHRPHRRRQPTWTPLLVERVLTLRRQYPRWGKDQLVVLLGREGRRVSTSMVGRILTRLKKRGLLVEPVQLDADDQTGGGHRMSGRGNALGASAKGSEAHRKRAARPRRVCALASLATFERGFFC
jgi:transposase